jgi:hypothetical protein
LIVARIVGGLGNQMFQYAAARALAIANDTELWIDLREMNKSKLRTFGLDQFSIQARVANSFELPSISRKGGLGSLIRAAWDRRLPYKQITETSHAYDDSIPNLRGSFHLSGYWQSELYFQASAAAIRSDFTLRSPMSSAREMVRADIEASSSPISIHVRRGDYVTNPAANAVHGTCEPEWYQEATWRMLEKVVDARFFVFSDDPQWARENLKVPASTVFVEPRGDGRDGEDMHLMAACHHHIIANSSFSWWGAWLNPRLDKHVIAPLRWFRASKKSDQDLIPVGWRRM